MVDESRDISTKEQMMVILRYVDNKGQVIERFVGVQHVTKTTSSKLKESIDEFLKLHDLSYSNLRGQGYDGASNMRVSTFCVEHEIEVPNMDDLYVIQGKSLRKAPRKTNHYHYKVELFFEVIDFQLTELDDRFVEEKLVHLARMYPKDFTDRDRSALQDQLDIYIHFVRADNDFSQLCEINELAKKMVEKGLHRTFAYLTLVLLVATASVESAFSSMNIIKGLPRNKMRDQWLSDNLVVYIEKDIFSCIGNEVIMEHFQTMKPRRGHLN
ncbi:unnamed protein product [Malus baccata var. baccata]